MPLKLPHYVAKYVMGPRYSSDRKRDSARLDKIIRDGRWDEVEPIQVEPNLGINGVIRGTVRPLIIRSDFHIFEKALEKGLTVRFCINNPLKSSPASKKRRKGMTIVRE